VSIPIGSEESYSFKHMRKNQFEESLFRCEDDRFEVDMLIDTNMSAIRVLQPLSEEIAALRQLTGKRDKEGHEGLLVCWYRSCSSFLSKSKSSCVYECVVNPVPRFSLQLEKRQLSTVHLNAIQRIYGDHGEEILELLRKNPASAIPVILKRLKQKDAEWRRARLELSRQWKETIEKNFYKSFDHRSFYFRQHDKKFLHTKQLVAELTSFAQSSESNQDAQHSGMLHASESSYETLFAGLVPALSLSYEHDAHWVHRLIFRLVCHAVEYSTSLSLSDKERVAALWRDLFRVMFSLPVHYLYSPGEREREKVREVVQGESYAIGTRVLTQYGSGTIRSFREGDGIYGVTLPFGIAYLSSNAILGAEELSPPALQVQFLVVLLFLPAWLVTLLYSCYTGRWCYYRFQNAQEYHI
jgi:paired amphipathic helix protein Sin3a